MSVRKICLSLAASVIVAIATIVPVATSAARPAKHVQPSAETSTSTVTCTGVQSKNVPGNLNVPAGATCTITHNVTVGNNVTVNQAATLIDQGATIQNNVTATDPKGIGIGGYGGTRGKIENNLTINGVSGQGPGTVTHGDNYICDTYIANAVLVENSAAGAGQWIIGDQDEECSGGGNQIDGNLTVANNRNRVDVSDNRKGKPPYSVGIGHNLSITGNVVNATSPVVESNFVGNNATCQSGTKKDGDGSPNIVEGTNHGCP